MVAPDVATPRTTAPPADALGVGGSRPDGLTFHGLGDAAFGVEVRGVQWNAPDADTVRLITAALRRHLLLVFRGQPAPDDAGLDAFFGGFGRLVLDTEDGKAHYLGHTRQEGPASEMAIALRRNITRRADNVGSTYYEPGAEGMGELVWHNDQSHRPMRKVLSVLEAQDVEDGATPTRFRDMYTACETLPGELRDPLAHRQVIYFDPRLPPPAELPRLADATHPLFTAHPHTGRATLYVNDFADRVAGMDRAESDVVLARLRAHTDAWSPTYVHQWRTGDVVVWDNIGVQHRRDEVPPHQRRRLRQYGGLAE